MASSQYHSGPKWLQHASKSPCNWWKNQGSISNNKKTPDHLFLYKWGVFFFFFTHIKGIFFFFSCLVECLRKATQSKRSHQQSSPHWRTNEDSHINEPCDWLPVPAHQTLVSFPLQPCQLAKPSHFLLRKVLLWKTKLDRPDIESTAVAGFIGTTGLRERFKVSSWGVMASSLCVPASCVTLLPHASVL